MHAGLYYRPGSLKAELCTRGRALIRDYCAEHGLPYDECGKLVVAVDQDELGRFAALEQTARANDVPGLRRVDGSGIAEIEPHAVGLAALHSPHTAITDFVAIAEQLGRGDRGARAAGSCCPPPSPASSARAGRIDVVCGAAPAPGRPAGRLRRPGVRPARRRWSAARRRRGSCRSGGSTCRSSPAKQELVRGMIYPVPDPRYPFLGVHFTRRVGGALEVGPNAFLALSRRGYGRLSARRRATSATPSRGPASGASPAEHWRTGRDRAPRRALEARLPADGAALRPRDRRRRRDPRAASGLRAQAVERDGSLVDDFVIQQEDGITSVRNAPSPAATSSLAIAEYVVDRMSG